MDLICSPHLHINITCNLMFNTNDLAHPMRIKMSPTTQLTNKQTHLKVNKLGENERKLESRQESASRIRNNGRIVGDEG